MTKLVLVVKELKCSSSFPILGVEVTNGINHNKERGLAVEWCTSWWILTKICIDKLLGWWKELVRLK